MYLKKDILEGKLTIEERKEISPYDYYDDFFNLSNYFYMNQSLDETINMVVLEKIKHLYTYNKDDIMSKIIMAKPSFNNNICKYSEEFNNIIIPIGDAFLTAHQAYWSRSF